MSSVDSAKKADGLEKGRKAHNSAATNGNANGVSPTHEDDHRLRVHVQVNTSGEGSKSGVEPSETTILCRHIVESCPNLKLVGLMTIGAIARSKETTPETENEDFMALKQVRDRVVGDLNLNTEDLELSMGMSDDFESAIRCGADEVRVGSTIFGERAAKGSKVPEGLADSGGSWASQATETSKE